MRTRSSAPHCGNPSNSTGARGRSALLAAGRFQPRQQAQQRALAAAAAPDHRHELAGGQLQVQAAQHHALAVALAQLAQRHAQRRRRSRLGLRRPGVRAALGPRAGRPVQVPQQLELVGVDEHDGSLPIPDPARARPRGPQRDASSLRWSSVLTKPAKDFGHGQELARAVGRRDVLHIGPGQIGRAHRHQVLVGGRGLSSASASVSLSPDASAKLPLTKE